MDTLQTNTNTNANGWQHMKASEIRVKMPRVAAKVAQLRRDWGADWVDAQIKASMRGVAGAFWAFEGGLEVGKPSDAQRREIAETLATCAGFGPLVLVTMAAPKGAAHGA